MIHAKHHAARRLRLLPAATACLLLGTAPMTAQKASPTAPTPPASAQPQTPQAPIERGNPAPDPAVDLVSDEIGRALFLRCFCAEENLVFDREGKPDGKSAHPKTLDWTLSGIDIQKVRRTGSGELQLEGVRVAVRYAPDRHEWERHPQKDETIRITLADSGDPAALRRALANVFSQGIDRRLQQSTPDFWQHYFEPTRVWPQDDLAGQMIYTPSPSPGPNAPPVTPVTATHQTDPGYTPWAQRDRVRGTVRLRIVVDAQGQPRHIAVLQPLGYGLDERAVEAVRKDRFNPATLNGRPVPAVLHVESEFVVVPPPHP